MTRQQHSLVPSLFDREIFPTNLKNLFDQQFLPSLTTLENGTSLSISEDNAHVYVEAALPGMDSKDIDLSIENDILWIRGQKKEETKDKERKYYSKLNRSFSYQLHIPETVDIEKEPKANYKNGIMEVTFQKKQKSTPKKINFKAEG